MNAGEKIYALARRLWPICRSITGHGVRQTLSIIRETLPALLIHEVPTGTRCFDWTVPKEWNIRAAYVLDPSGNKVIDYSRNNLHVVGYSLPVDTELSLDELQGHLYSLPEQPDAVPYITSYYQERWGFCIAHRERERLQTGTYRVKIDSALTDGSMSFGELVIPGEIKDEVLLSTYVCHPSMANNELSGPCVATYIAQWLQSLPRRRYTYRILFAPETIGSICYMSRHLSELKSRVIAGFVITCVGDDRTYSYLPSRQGDTLSDRTALHVLKHIYPGFRRYTFLDRGSDERQYCSPGVDLPIASIMRSKYGEYPEYHTSLDDLDLITPAGLEGGFNAIKRALGCIEDNCIPRVTVLCEPQMGRRGLYPTLSTTNPGSQTRNMMNLLAYADGRHSLLEIADIIGVPMWDISPIAHRLVASGVLELGPSHSAQSSPNKPGP